jgi:phosphinothricin acetyltransferase
MVTADLEPVSVESKRAWFENHNHNNRPLWIIEHEGSYIGWMSFNSFYGRPAYEGTAELSLYLEAAARGKGFGKRSLQYALREASTRKVHTLLGFIFGHNLQSIQLFTSLGFEQWGHLPKVANMGDGYRDLLIFGIKTNN